MKKTLPKILLGVVLACALFLVFLYATNDIGNTATSLSFGYFFLGGGDIVAVDDYIAEFVVEGYTERAFISMNTQNVVRVEIDDGNGVRVIDIDSGKPFAIVLPLNAGDICFYDTIGNAVEYHRQLL